MIDYSKWGKPESVVTHKDPPQDIDFWIRGKKPAPLFAPEPTCPKCGRNTTAALKHYCP